MNKPGLWTSVQYAPRHWSLTYYCSCNPTHLYQLKCRKWAIAKLLVSCDKNTLSRKNWINWGFWAWLTSQALSSSLIGRFGKKKRQNEGLANAAGDSLRNPNGSAGTGLDPRPRQGTTICTTSANTFTLKMYFINSWSARRKKLIHF